MRAGVFLYSVVKALMTSDEDMLLLLLVAAFFFDICALQLLISDPLSVCHDQNQATKIAMIFILKSSNPVTFLVV